MRFTPESDQAALIRRRIRAGELLFLAGDMDLSLEHLELLDLDRLATADLEQALPLLLDLTDFIQGTAAATAIVTHAVGAARAAAVDPRRHALVLALASDVVYGIPRGKRDAAIEAISCAEAAGAPADAALHRALVNLFIAKVTAAEGLDTGLLDRAARLEAGLPPTRLHDSADMHRGWCRYTEDLDTARTALRRCMDRAKDLGDDWALATFSCFLATTAVLAGDYAAAAAAVDAADAAAAWYDWPPHPWHVEPRCELLIRDGDLDGAAGLVDESLPGDADASSTARITARFMGACLRGKVSAWRGDHAATIRHLERAARCADQLDWADPGVRCGLDILLAETYLAAGRTDDARRISAWLRELGGRLGRPALTGDARRIDAVLQAEAGDLDAAAVAARAAVAAHESSPLRPELTRSLLVLGRIERRRKARRQAREALARARDGRRDGAPAAAGPDRAGAAARGRRAVRHRADRHRAAGRRPDRGRRDQPGRRGDAVRQRAHRGDARSLDLPQAGRTHPRRTDPPDGRSVVLLIPRRSRPAQARQISVRAADLLPAPDT